MGKIRQKSRMEAVCRGMNPIIDQELVGSVMGGDIEPSGRNDYLKPLVDEVIEDLREKKQDEVPY